MGKRSRRQKQVEDDNKCYYCRRELQLSDTSIGTYRTRDHFYPKSKFYVESKDREVLVPCCIRCNQLKGDQDPFFFLFTWQDKKMPEWPFNKSAKKLIARIWMRYKKDKWQNEQNRYHLYQNLGKEYEPERNLDITGDDQKKVRRNNKIKKRDRDISKGKRNRGKTST